MVGLGEFKHVYWNTLAVGVRIRATSFAGEVVVWYLKQIGLGQGVLGIRTPLQSRLGLDSELG